MSTTSNTQKPSATTSSSTPNLAKGASNTSSSRDGLKTPPTKCVMSPPGAPRQRVIQFPERPHRLRIGAQMIYAMNYGQDPGATTSSTTTKLEQSANDTSPFRDRLKTPPTKCVMSPPGAPRQRVIQRTGLPRRIRVGAQMMTNHATHHSIDDFINTRITSFALDEVISNGQDSKNRHPRPIREVQHGHEDPSTVNPMLPIQHHGNSSAPSSFAFQQGDNSTSNTTVASNSEEPFCLVNQAEQDEEANFW